MERSAEEEGVVFFALSCGRVAGMLGGVRTCDADRWALTLGAIHGVRFRFLGCHSESRFIGKESWGCGQLRCFAAFSMTNIGKLFG